jgi:DNA polymerase-3 subunit epsilon
MICFDTETTGLTKPDSVPLADQPRIIELAAIKLDHKTLKEVARLSFLVNPGAPLDEFTIKNTGITDAMLKDAGSFASHYPELVDFTLGERELVGHNLEFDKTQLQMELLRMGRLLRFPWPPVHMCTVEASFSLKNRRLHLDELFLMATGKEHKHAHRAMPDAEALVASVRWLRKKGLL